MQFACVSTFWLRHNHHYIIANARLTEQLRWDLSFLKDYGKMVRPA
jgi:hypothetical protein